MLCLFCQEGTVAPGTPTRALSLLSGRYCSAGNTHTRSVSSIKSLPEVVLGKRMMMMMMIIALKGDLRFFTISSLRRKLSPTRTLKWPGRNRTQITCNMSSAYRVQHVERLSRATCRAPITCNMSSVYHVQHVERLSRATRRALITCNMPSAYHVQHVVCHVVRRDS